LVFEGSTGARLGYLGGDGWFYAWEINLDPQGSFWPMAGHDASGSYALPTAALGDPNTDPNQLPSDRFYAWPNPVLDGSANIRYYLGETASHVSLTFYDLSGREIETLSGTVFDGVDNEVLWNCSGVTPGVYRCIIEATFDSGSEQLFTDIAVIK